LRAYLATKNRHKVWEINAILAATGIVFLPCPEEVVFPEETGTTFEENAFQKACFVRGILPEDAFVVAEDSGLCVAALDGLPGVRSARFVSDVCDMPKNIEKLLVMMERIAAPEQRTARFVTVVCLLGPGIREFFRGEKEGVITFSPRGTGGFGYDPVFEVSGTGKTFAELAPEEKNAVSHRSVAFRNLADYLMRTVI